MRYVILSALLLGSLSVAQPYRCDWSVAGIAGGDMTGTAYRCGSTAGQTAVGAMAGTGYQAFVGFWQIEEEVGVQEGAKWPSGLVMETKLHRPWPNPARSHVAVRYSLASNGPVSLVVHDLTGRAVRRLLVSSVKRGTYSVTWDGRDDRRHMLANGVYFLKFSSDDYRSTEKVILQR